MTDEKAGDGRRDAMTPELRSARSRKAALAMHAKHDGRKVTAKARAAALAKIDAGEGRTAFFRRIAKMRKYDD